MTTEEKIEFSNKELQQKYEYAKFQSEVHLRRLDVIGADIRRAEDFLQKSGFGEFEKKYGHIHLNFGERRLRCGGVPLMETRVKLRLEVYPFLGDFLESIAYFHSNLGVSHEGN